MTRKQSFVALANEHVDIRLVCRWIGLYVPEEIMSRSIKVRCPFGDVYHIDHGTSPSFRVYPETNSAYCFAACGYFTPVWLAATAWNRETNEVAADLLNRINYEPESISQLWDKARAKEPPPDLSYLSLALKTYCERIDSEWDAHQFDSSIAKTLGRCLALLDRVYTPDDVQEWLSCGKVIMRRVLGGCDERRQGSAQARELGNPT